MFEVIFAFLIGFFVGVGVGGLFIYRNKKCISSLNRYSKFKAINCRDFECSKKERCILENEQKR